MDGTNPLYIPELLIMIANHLGKYYVINCLQVCKHWHRVLAPLLWRSVHIRRDPEDTDIGITREWLLKYSDLIFELSDDFIHPDHCTMTFPNLRTVHLPSKSFKTRNNLGESYAAQFIALNPSLVNICVYQRKSTSDIQFWKAASNLQHLKSITADGFALHKDEMETFWKVLSKLEEVHLRSSRIPMDCHQPSSMFYQLRKIKLDARWSDFDVQPQLQLIRLCPNLENLFWGVNKEAGVLDEFAEDIEHGLWPKLEVIDLYHYRKDEYSSRILNSMQRVTEITLGGQFGLTSFQSLQRHFSTLIRVDLKQCREVASPFILEILCSCPLLEEFAAGILYAKYIENCRPWICLSIKRLCLCFVFTESEGNLHPQVFKRLSTLTHLLHLDISEPGYSSTLLPNETYLDMRLKSGLGLLSSCRNIRKVDITNTKQVMDGPEIKWINSSWDHTVSIYGDLNQDPIESFYLWMTLRKRGRPPMKIYSVSNRFIHFF